MRDRQMKALAEQAIRRYRYRRYLWRKGVPVTVIFSLKTEQALKDLAFWIGRGVAKNASPVYE